jgi:16S rRNA (adenine1518-N6/adenine1519-N6)-dimethyltransferase
VISPLNLPPPSGGFSTRQTLEILAKLGHSPKKPLGQNFLVDANIVRKSIELAAIEPGCAVVEIGPGLGTLTAALLSAGARVFAVERDPVLARHLRSWLTPLFPDTFHLLEADAVRHPLAGMPERLFGVGREGVGGSVPAGKAGVEGKKNGDLGNASKPPPPVTPSVPPFPDFKVVANLPYAISTPWISALLEAPALPSRMVVMLQKETAERLTATPENGGGKSVSAISIALDCAFERATSHGIPPSCFHPAPRVDSVLLHLVRKPAPRRLRPVTRGLLRALFLCRRKQIGTLLRKLPMHNPAIDGWLARLPEWGATAQSRPESIPFPAWHALDDMLADLTH